VHWNDGPATVGMLKEMMTAFDAHNVETSAA
jgi:hypothetical protein